ncbi:MAG: glycosyltransferase [Thermoplasmataceae archaeon]
MKVGIIADGMNTHTGYGKMALNTAIELSNLGFEVFQISFSHRGSPVEYGISSKDAYRNRLKFKLYSGTIYESGNTSQIDKAIETEKPDILLTIRDPVTFIPGQPFSFNLKKWKGKIQRYSYVPVMTPSIPDDVFMALVDNSDHVFAFTDTAKSMLTRKGFPYNKCIVIPPGYDPEIYHRCEPSITISNMPDNPSIFAFVGLNNDRRKHTLALFLAFKEYLKSDPNAYLYVHNSENRQYPLMTAIRHIGINGHVILPKANGVSEWNPDSFYTEQQMAGLYSSLTAIVSASSQEGFNMPFLEAMACGTPAVGVALPFYDWSDQIIQVKSIQTEIAEARAGIGWVSDPKDFAEGMLKAKDKKIDVSALKQFEWKNTIGKMAEIFDENKV